MSLRENFRDAIRQRRLELGLTQTELGRRMGVSHAMVSQAETSVNAPTLDMVERFAKALQCPPLVLLMQPADRVQAVA